MTPADRSLDRYRPLLHLHVRQLRLGRLHGARFDSSDVVQETFAKAVHGLDGFRGQTEAQLVAWLRRILRNVLVDFVRATPGSGLEVSIDAADDGGTPLGAYITATTPGPSTLARRKEDILRVAAAVARLPGDEQDAVVARHILGLPVPEVAVRLGRTTKGAAMLIYRATCRLKKLLADEEGEA
jgi:RNA polymerase sigma-70 factor (ECF subfamily)